MKKKPQPKRRKKEKTFYDGSDDNFDDVDTDNNEFPDEQFEFFSTAPLAAGRMEARRAIELAREERALRLALEDFSDY